MAFLLFGAVREGVSLFPLRGRYAAVSQRGYYPFASSASIAMVYFCWVLRVVVDEYRGFGDD